MTDDEIIAVIQAHKEGKQIECRAKPLSPFHLWGLEVEGITWNFRDLDYRVKPEPPKPREFWITVYEGQLSSTWKHPVAKYSADEVIHVREVL